MCKFLLNFLRKDAIWIFTIVIALSNYFSYRTSSNAERKNIIENNIILMEKIYYSSTVSDAISLKDFPVKRDFTYCQQEKIVYETTCERYPYISGFFLPFREHLSENKIKDIYKLMEMKLDSYLSLKRMEKLLSGLPDNYSSLVEEFNDSLDEYIGAYRELRVFLLTGCNNYDLDIHGKRDVSQCVEYINKIHLDTLTHHSNRFSTSSKKLYDSYQNLMDMMYLQLRTF